MFKNIFKIPTIVKGLVSVFSKINNLKELFELIDSLKKIIQFASAEFEDLKTRIE